MIRNLSGLSQLSLLLLDIYAGHLRQAEPRTETRAVRLLLTMLMLFSISVNVLLNPVSIQHGKKLG